MIMKNTDKINEVRDNVDEIVSNIVDHGYFSRYITKYPKVNRLIVNLVTGKVMIEEAEIGRDPRSGYDVLYVFPIRELKNNDDEPVESVASINDVLGKSDDGLAIDEKASVYDEMNEDNFKYKLIVDEGALDFLCSEGVEGLDDDGILLKHTEECFKRIVMESLDT